MRFDYEKPMRLAKPCPLCGSKDVVTESRESFYDLKRPACTYVRCVDCDVQVFGDPVRDENDKFVEDYNVAERQALKKWNRRTAV